MATTAAQVAVNGTGTPTSIISQLRALHRAAGKAFLLRDYAATSSALSSAFDVLAKLPTPESDAWLVHLEDQGDDRAVDNTLELRRKLAILRVTFAATAAHSATTTSAPLPPSLLAQFPLLEKKPDELLKVLWASLLDPTWSSSSSSAPPPDILPSLNAAFLHPSLPTALALAALKLDQPRLARAVAEAWFGSVDARVEHAVSHTIAARQPGDESIPFAFVEDGATSMDASTASLASGTHHHHQHSDGSHRAGAAKDRDGGAALATSWVKLHDLLALHILPRLEEWDAAGDFVRSQAPENGGFLPDDRVEATIAQIASLRERAMQAHLAAQERDRAQAAEATRALRRSTAAKGKARASEPALSPPPRRPPKGNRMTGPPSASSSSSSSHAVPAPAAKGFAALRTTLSSFLDQSHDPNGSGVPAVGSTTTTTTFASRLVRALQRQDPTRLLATVCVVFAALSWIRRLRRGTDGERRTVRGVIGSVATKVSETVRMGVKVTSL